MYYTNELEIEMKDNATAMKALEVMKSRLEKGFEIDKIYRTNPSLRMMNELYVDKNLILVPEECGYHCPEEADDVFIELLKAIATELPEESFTCDIFNNCDYTESSFEAIYENGCLRTKTTYIPEFVIYLCCPECEMEVVEVENYDPSKTYICPECGEEVDLTEAYDQVKPQITERVIKIEK